MIPDPARYCGQTDTGKMPPGGEFAVEQIGRTLLRDRIIFITGDQYLGGQLFRIAYGLPNTIVTHRSRLLQFAQEPCCRIADQEVMCGIPRIVVQPDHDGIVSVAEQLEGSSCFGAIQVIVEQIDIRRIIIPHPPAEGVLGRSNPFPT